MESQTEDSLKVKSHDEIMRLFKDLEAVETRVKNPEEIQKEILESEQGVNTIQPTLHSPEQALEDHQALEPASDVPQSTEEKQRRKLWRRTQKQNRDPEPKKQRFSFLKGTPPLQSDLTPTLENLEDEQKEHLARPTRSTFVLEFDSNGTLVGFPLKRPKLEKEKKRGFFSRKNGQDNPEGEPVKGIKGKLKQLGSLFHRNESKEAGSSEGIGTKIKGIFRRKSKE